MASVDCRTVSVNSTTLDLRLDGVDLTLGAKLEAGVALGKNEPFVESLDLTPSPRLLEVLGDIPYKPWQCLAELIDNAFDDFLSEETRDPLEPPVVEITLPKPGTAEGDELVCVADNGRGMNLERFERALRAGYSPNSRYGSLGLFGMGFNIATANLGSVTEVRTTRAGDPDWTHCRDRLSRDAATPKFHGPPPSGPQS